MACTWTNRWLLLTALLVALAPACGGGEEGGEGEGEGKAGGCTTDDECAAGFYCYVVTGATRGVCAAGCRLAPDTCPAGKHCDPQQHKCLGPIETCLELGCPEVGTWCDVQTGECVPGCDALEDCPGDCQRCNTETHACEDTTVCSASHPCPRVDGQYYLCDTTVPCGACVPGCEVYEDCRNDPARPLCEAGQCVPCRGCPAQCNDQAPEGQYRCPAGWWCDGGLCTRECSTNNECVAELGEGHVCCLEAETCPIRRCVPRCTVGGAYDCPVEQGQYCREDGQCARGCTGDDACRPGEICEAHDCIPGCHRDEQCPAAQVCGVDLHCRDGCRGDAGCAAHQVCGVDRRCVPRPCDTDGDCPAGVVPDSWYCEEDTFVCTQGCRDDGSCPDETVCDPAGRGCIPPCHDDESCTAGTVCDPESQLCLPGCRPDRFDLAGSNEGPATATEVAPEGDAWEQAELTLCSGDEDWFVIRLEHQELEAAIRYEVAGGDLSLQLYEPQAQVALASAANPGQAVQLVRSPGPLTGTYYLRVAGVRLAGPTGLVYGLELHTAGGGLCLPDHLEGEAGNDTWAAARSLGSGLHEHLRICPGNEQAEPPAPPDEDWYTFRLWEGDGLAATITYADGGTALAFELYGPGGIEGPELLVAGTSPDGQPGTKQLSLGRVASDGAYYLLVAPIGEPDQGVEYTLELTLDTMLECTDDGFEDNDDRVAATALPGPLFLASWPGLQVCLDDEDWYQVDLQLGDILRVEVHHAFELGNLDAELYRAGQRIQVAATQSDDERLLLLVDGLQYFADTYFIRVFSPTRAQNGYDLAVSVELSAQSCPADLYEPNDDPAGARELRCGGTLHGLVGCPGDDDYFRVTTFRHGRIEATMPHTVAAGELALTLVDAQGELLAEGMLSDVEPDLTKLIRHHLEPGDYYLSVHSFGLPNRYSLSASCAAEEPVCRGDRFEPNPDASPTNLAFAREFGELVPQEYLYGDLSICPGDEDWFQFLTRGGDHFDFLLRFYHMRDGDLGMALYCGGLEPERLVAVSDDTNDDERIVYDVPEEQDGICYLHVYGSPKEETGEPYSLHVRPYYPCVTQRDCDLLGMVCDLGVQMCVEP